MNTSSLAIRLEEFEAENQPPAQLRPIPQTQMIAPALAPAPAQQRRAPRRMTFTSRRIQLRDPGLRQFRVF
jgi:hypothetical protein